MINLVIPMNTRYFWPWRPPSLPGGIPGSFNAWAGTTQPDLMADARATEKNWKVRIWAWTDPERPLTAGRDGEQWVS